MSAVLATLSGIAAVVISLSLVYFLVEMGAGIHELRKRKVALGVQGDAGYESTFDGDPGTYDVYVLIPCLNEATVIGPTVNALSGGMRSTVIVVDDGSDDETGQVATSAGGPDTIVVRRELPEARRGKGAALNAGYATVRRLAAERGQDPDRVLVLVMDADGRLSDGAFARVLPLFDDPDVGGVQLGVRIRNRHTNFLTWFQDFQFWSMSAITQLGRAKTGTVSLGGNGQFTRLSALTNLEDAPWSGSLTEDLVLAIHLLNDGWTLATTPHASVDQQAVDSLGRLIRQRRRWYQGHMTAVSELPRIWTNPRLSNVRALELTGYLIVPWLFDLPWSILWHLTMVMFATRVDAVFAFVTGPVSLLIGVVLWYLLTFAPALFTSIVYLRRDATVTLPRALLLGHSFVVTNYLSFICAWGALFRMIRGETGWDKTKRSAETARAPQEA